MGSAYFETEKCDIRLNLSDADRCLDALAKARLNFCTERIMDWCNDWPFEYALDYQECIDSDGVEFAYLPIWNSDDTGKYPLRTVLACRILDSVDFDSEPFNNDLSVRITNWRPQGLRKFDEIELSLCRELRMLGQLSPLVSPDSYAEFRFETDDMTGGFVTRLNVALEDGELWGKYKMWEINEYGSPCSEWNRQLVATPLVPRF